MNVYHVRPLDLPDETRERSSLHFIRSMRVTRAWRNDPDPVAIASKCLRQTVYVSGDSTAAADRIEIFVYVKNSHGSAFRRQ
jgi:hypothetical protein